ncbi:MAG: CinA family protein [Clostridia bacterium]|nr:CinA family protein [Clostridia bacterium]
MNTEILKSAEELVSRLKANRLKIATAESCTGGMLSSYITAVSGASRVFEMGITSYSNRIKNSILKVDAETLKTHGAVSQQTAAQMAENVRSISSADIGVSVTGVAGPDGQDGYSAGVVFVGISYQNHTAVHKLEIEPRDRNFVRESAVLELLNLVITLLK